MNFSETVLAVFLGTLLAQLAILSMTGRLRFKMRRDYFSDYYEPLEGFEPVTVPNPGGVIDLRDGDEYTRLNRYN